MNKAIVEAMKIDEFGTNLPDLEIGDTVTLADVWDGNGDAPETSYSYELNSTDFIDYEFDIVEKNENPLETIVKITDISIK